VIYSELAGEIKDIWPVRTDVLHVIPAKSTPQEKEVTIVHGQRLLFNDAYPDRFRKSAAGHYTARGIKLLLDEIVEDVPAEAGPATVLTRDGHKLTADLVVSSSSLGRYQRSPHSRLKPWAPLVQTPPS
jgi:hypothetical protein